MNCIYCGSPLVPSNICPGCGANVYVWKQASSISNKLYNEGLAKCNRRDLSGAIESLKLSLKYNKLNMDARNLLGLVYFEMGEYVNAISEWVISKSYMPDNNPASNYLGEVQNSSITLQNLDETIKKYNQALLYCQQGDTDLAIIQLKKVLSLNEGMVKAQQLMALLLIKEEKYEEALTHLRVAAKVDANNSLTKKYARECKEQIKAASKAKIIPTVEKKKEDEAITYQSGNETIIRPVHKFRDNMAFMTVINLLIGAAIGCAVVFFLVVPSIRQNANSTASNQVVEANETVATKEQAITNLQDEVDQMKKEVADANKAAEAADKKSESYEALLGAYADYKIEHYTAAAEAVKTIDQDLLDENGKAMLDSMMGEIENAMIKTTYDEAMNFYENHDYVNAIRLFDEVVEKKESYKAGNAAYFLAFACYYEGQNSKALKWYEKTVEYTDDDDVRAIAQEIVDTLKAQGVTADQ